MSIAINLLLGIWGLVAVLMVLVILMQRPKSEGLGAAFGGAVTENLFGAQTTNVLVKFTAWLAGIFFVITFILSVLYAHRSLAESSLSRELKKGASAPLNSPAAAASPAANAQPSPGSSPAPATSSPAPDSGAGVVPAGGASVSPVASPAASAARTEPAASPKNPKP
jgi:preprotein translocase subunit SecG